MYQHFTNMFSFFGVFFRLSVMSFGIMYVNISSVSIYLRHLFTSYVADNTTCSTDLHKDVQPLCFATVQISQAVFDYDQ